MSNVGLSIGGSMAATHAMFQIDGTIYYRDAMLVAFCIPALVAPPSFLYYVWVARRMEQLNAQLDRLARQDPLTGLDNRRAFVEQASARLKGRSAHMLVMVDLDHFKHINDTFGHDAGDQLLRFVANSIRADVRDDIVVGRWGGDEFVAVLFNGVAVLHSIFGGDDVVAFHLFQDGADQAMAHSSCVDDGIGRTQLIKHSQRAAVQFFVSIDHCVGAA